MRAEAPPCGGSPNLQIPVLNGARPAGFGTRTSPVPLSNRTRLRLAQRCELPKQLFPYLTQPRHYAASGLLNLLTTLVRTLVRTTPGRKLQATKLTDSARIRHAAPGLASEATIYARNRTRQIKSGSTPNKNAPPTNRTNAPPKPETKPRQAVAQKGDTHTPESGTERRRQGPKPAGITPCRPPDKAPNAVKTRFCNSDKICYLCLRIRKSRRGGARKRSPEPAVKASLLTHVDL